MPGCMLGGAASLEENFSPCSLHLVKLQLKALDFFIFWTASVTRPHVTWLSHFVADKKEDSVRYNKVYWGPGYVILLCSGHSSWCHIQYQP